MNADFIQALEDIEREKGISKEYMLTTIEAALAAAYKRSCGQSQDVRVTVDREKGDVAVFRCQLVVPDEEELDNEESQIHLSAARAINPRMQAGMVLEQPVNIGSFGYTAAQTAKQVVVQRIREAERGRVMDEFSEKENEILTALVQRVEKGNVYVDLGNTEGYIPATEQMSGEKYLVNDRIKVYVVEVRKGAVRGPQIVVSRSHPGLVKRLFEMEVPEIHSGVVQIKNIAREAGARTKIAVTSKDEEVDAIGACLGQRSNRKDAVSAELKGERIDIIKWSVDPAEYIANSLSPARVVMVTLNEQEKTARVVVPDNQLSLAIGKEGQNARLAAKLTGWKIDIKSQSQTVELMD
jgi:N utilization substance protein A